MIDPLAPRKLTKDQVVDLIRRTKRNQEKALENMYQSWLKRRSFK